MADKKANKNAASEWTKHASSSRPGMFFLFNKATGESKWCKADNDDTTLPSTSKDIPVKTTKLMRGEANERLHRLQHKFQLGNKRSDKKISPTKAKPVKKSDVKEKQRSINLTPVLKNQNQVQSNQKQKPTTRKRKAESEAKEVKPSITLKQKKLDMKPASKPEDKVPSSLGQKVKDMCGKAFKSILGPKYKIPKKTEEEKSQPSCQANVPIEESKRQESRSDMPTYEDISLPLSSSELKSRNDFNFFGMGGTSLHTTAISPIKKPESTSRASRRKEKIKNPATISISDSSTPVSGQANRRLKMLQTALKSQEDIEPRTSLPISTDGACDCDEPMDWEPSVEENVEEAKTSRQKAEDLSVSEDEPTMADYYDKVETNKLRASADGRKSRSGRRPKQWLTDYYYFVLDTNILMNCLTYIDDVLKLKPPGTQGAVIYIPYKVLQELDGLKQGEKSKTLAIRAIRFLNKKFENQTLYVQAQSAVDEGDHIIDVTSPDDSILNCCLQVKENISQVMLLSEDVNLRNKALSSDLQCHSIKDALSKFKRFDSLASQPTYSISSLDE